MASLLTKVRRTPVVTEGPPPSRSTTHSEPTRENGEGPRSGNRQMARSIHIRQVDAGSCNGCELEINALNGPHYDLEQYGLHLVASPRHADCLLVTGPVTRNMADPLKRTYDATPAPKFVVAVGDCARDCGVFAGGYGLAGSVADVIPVDGLAPGCPPEPRAILAAILAAAEKRSW